MRPQYPEPEAPVLFRPQEPPRCIVVGARDVDTIVPAPPGWVFHWAEVVDCGRKTTERGPHRYLGPDATWSDGASPVVAFGVSGRGDGCAMVLAGDPDELSPVWVRNFSSGPGGWLTAHGRVYFGRGSIKPAADAIRGKADAGGGFFFMREWLTYDRDSWTPQWQDPCLLTP